MKTRPASAATYRNGDVAFDTPSHVRRRRARIGRTAFTLLEVLLALTLSVVLLAGIFAALDQSWKLTVTGRQEMERSQLARALLRKMALDIRAIAFVPPLVTDSDAASGTSGNTSTTSSSSSSGSSSSGSSSTSSTSGTSTTEETPSAKSIGVRGNAQRIEMHLTRARRDLEFSANVDGNKVHTHTSDLRVVTYQLAATGSTTTSSGLIRTEGDRMATQLVEEKGGSATSLSGAQALAPEVSSLQFRYFDGKAWYPAWDSEEAGRLPRAIEITLAFAPPKVQLGAALNVAVSASANQFRTVVMIPIADPLPEEFVQ